MRKTLIIFVFTFLGYVAHAQLNFGVKGGVNFASIKASGSGITISSNGITSFQLGAFANYELNEQFKLQPELLFMGIGGTAFTGEKINVNYVALPIMAQYYLGEKFYLEAGPQFGLLLSAKEAGTDIKSMFKSTDLQLAGGAGFKLSDNFIVGARYGFSISNIDAFPGETAKNRCFSLTLAYQF